LTSDYYIFYSPKKLVAKFKKKHRKQTQVNLANMPLFRSFSAQPGLRDNNKFNINIALPYATDVQF